VSERHRADVDSMQGALPCCDGSGLADYAAMPCEAPGCDAAARRLAAAETEALPVQAPALPVQAPASSALAAHDDMVGYGFTPTFDALADELGGDPRGIAVRTWEEINYTGGRRGRVGDSEDGGTGGGRGHSGRRESGAEVPGGAAAPGGM